MAIAPPLTVPTPTLSPARGGLLSVATIAPDGDQHWQNGVRYAVNAAPAAVADEVSCDPIVPADLPEGFPWVDDEPLRVSTGFTCKSVGLTKDEINAYARAKLVGGESAALERAVWARIMGDPATTNLGATAVPQLEGLGDLEDWLYESYAGLGVLHVARGAVPALMESRHLTESGGQIVTRFGTKVSAGAYPITGPADAAADAGAVWVAATAAVTYRRTEIRVRTDNGSAYFDYSNNSVYGLADRIYVIGWEHTAAAAQLTLEV